MGKVVGNRDSCGRCHTRHGGNDHLCDVHGAVSRECCPPPGCNRDEWHRVVYISQPNDQNGYDQVRSHVLAPGEWPPSGASVRLERTDAAEAEFQRARREAAEAQQRLIAAAPTLLEACKLVEREFSNPYPHPEQDALSIAIVLQAVKLAIAQAEGEE